jgi:hypothetical protein
MWQDFKIAWEWIFVPLLLGLVWLPWGTLIRWAKQEVEKPGNEVL